MKLSYQPIIREYTIIYAHAQIGLADRGLLHHIYLSANPRTGIYYTHARRLAEETCTHVETIRQSQKRLKRAGLLIYKHAQTARLRPYYLPGFILFKTDKKDMHVTRDMSEIIAAGRKQKIFNTRTTEKQVIEFICQAGDSWPKSFFSLFAKRIHGESSIFEVAPTINMTWGEPDAENAPKPLPDGNDVSALNQAAKNDFLERAAKSLKCGQPAH